MKNKKIRDFGKLYQGVKREAFYTKSPIPDYNKNPLLQALPPIMTDKQAIIRLSHLPEYDGSMREQNDSVRYHLLRTSLRFFKPLTTHIELERAFGGAIRQSYLDRNLAKSNYLIEVEQKVNKFKSDWNDPYNIQDDYVSTCAPGFNWAGISGGGKSQTAQRILGTYPQVIYHNEHLGQEFAESQIVWLKLDCPFNGSIKGLCFSFFNSVDTILGTKFLKTHAGGKRTANEMVPLMATVAANHHLGVLVIDEIQRLNSAASGGDEEMLNFFVQLVNTLGVAIVLVGTFSALEILGGTFSQMRRGTGEGDFVWDRMSFDTKWHSFVKTLWRYQFTREKTSLEQNPGLSLEQNPGLSKALYDECHGITDLAIKAYRFAQERAIATGNEVIDADIIKSAAMDKFKIIRPALDAFKNKDKMAFKHFEDAYPLFLRKYIQEESSLNATVEGAINEEPEIKAAVEESKKNSSKPKDSGSSTVTKKGKEKKAKMPVEGILPDITKGVAENQGKTVYEALNESGHITPDVLGFGKSSEKSEGGQL